jgi:non-homologous end joining protein Ku
MEFLFLPCTNTKAAHAETRQPTAKVVNFMEALRKSLRKTPTVASSAHRRRRSA